MAAPDQEGFEIGPTHSTRKYEGSRNSGGPGRDYAVAPRTGTDLCSRPACQAMKLRLQP